MDLTLQNSKMEIASMPKRRRNLLPLSEKVKVLDLIRKDKKSYSEVAKIYGKNESSIREIVKKEKAIRSSFAILPHTSKATSTVRDKYLVKTEQALNLWVREMNIKCVPIDGNVIRQKALMLYKDFHRESPASNLSKPFTASKGWLHRFRLRFDLKVSKDSSSHGENVVAAFTTGMKKSIKVSQEPNGFNETGLSQKKMRNRTYIHTTPQFDEKVGTVNNCEETKLPWEKLPEIIYTDIVKRVCTEDDTVSLRESHDEIVHQQVQKLLWDDFKEIIKKPSSRNMKKTEDKPTVWTLEKFSEVFQIAQTLKNKIMNFDPIVERSIKITDLITEALEPLQQHFDELQRKTS
ncbi:HTH CENPB-type domain-containing protein [Nephila pilipes]|uniref:HTH CENPB-type domain-containing protein n=1 Tax=Nephila pilipes TaxID=299642 RepID=A0A8X6N654_NEPPI|nr:HTH CENPB-type domain-containing protein [Nephila pilipes]